jgi:hypothetical protein
VGIIFTSGQYRLKVFCSLCVADLLERDEDLTLEEAEIMLPKDVVTLAKGRPEVIHTKVTKPRNEIEEFVKDRISSTNDEAINIAVSDSSASPPMPVVEEVSNIPKPPQIELYRLTLSAQRAYVVLTIKALLGIQGHRV